MKQSIKNSVYVDEESMIFLNNYSDRELIDYLQNDENADKSAAFSVLYSRHSVAVYNYCHRVFGDGYFADDIFQETFIKFIRVIQNKSEIDNVRGYLLRSARNLSINFKRNNSHEFVELDEEQFYQIDNNFEEKELTKLINSALELLPNEHKEAFLLQNTNGMSYQEISNVTEVPISTVRNRIVRAKSKLREILSPILDYKEK